MPTVSSLAEPPIPNPQKLGLKPDDCNMFEGYDPPPIPNPQKLGLKHEMNYLMDSIRATSNTESTETRIETDENGPLLNQPTQTSNTESTETRIETF